jgi:uncharacterized protein
MTPTKFEVSGNNLAGYAAVWDSASKMISENKMQFTEYVRRGAFAASLAGDVVALWHHGVGRPPLGRISAGTLKLQEDDVGLRFELNAPNWAMDIVEAIDRRDVNGMSFGADMIPGGHKWSRNGSGSYIHEITRANLNEISFVIVPAYSATSVVLRSQLIVPELPFVPDPKTRSYRRRLQLAQLGG